MALIKCPECGREISDKASFCPGCGCPASEFKQNNVPEDTRSELDRIADEIFWKCPKLVKKCSKELVNKTGIDRVTADNMIFDRWKKYTDEMRAGKFINVEMCPHCGSQEAEYFYDQGVVVTRQSVIFKDMLVSCSVGNGQRLKCTVCGYTWKPKQKK